MTTHVRILLAAVFIIASGTMEAGAQQTLERRKPKPQRNKSSLKAA